MRFAEAASELDDRERGFDELVELLDAAISHVERVHPSECSIRARRQFRCAANTTEDEVIGTQYRLAASWLNAAAADAVETGVADEETIVLTALAPRLAQEIGNADHRRAVGDGTV